MSSTVYVECGEHRIGGSSEELQTALDKVFRPVIANLIREIRNPKFQKLRKSNAKIKEALTTLEGSEHLLDLAGFKETTSEGEVFLAFNGTIGTLMKADACITSLEESIKRSRCDTVELAPGKAMKKAIADRTAHYDKVQQMMARDSRESLEAEAERKREEKRKADQAKDFDDAKHLIETAKVTIHHSGRLRNALFGGTGFTLRYMRHGRAFACTTCDGENLEAHWHVRTSNLIYSYIVHLNSDATNVVHAGDEHGYQYNTLPGTEHFGKTVHMSWRRLKQNVDGRTLSNDAEKNETDEKAASPYEHLTPGVPVTACHYCGISFDTLWI